MDTTRHTAGHRVGPFRALAFSFEIHCSDALMAAYLGRVLTDLRDRAPRAASHRYTMVDCGASAEERYRVWFDDQRIACTPFAHAALSGLLWHLNRQVVATGQHRILVHASAVELNGIAALFPAPMESGKTTLVAGLLERSPVRYLTDEAVAIDPADGGIDPFPKPLTIDEGSWAVLPGLRPTWPPELQPYMRAQWHVPASSIRPACVAQKAAPRLLVVPRYAPDRPTRMESLSRARALLLLADQAFNLRTFGTSGVEVLAAMLRGCTCYTLEMSDLDEACQLVLSVLDELLPTGVTRRAEAG